MRRQRQHQRQRSDDEPKEKGGEKGMKLSNMVHSPQPLAFTCCRSVLKDVRGAKQSKAKISKDLDKIPLTQIYFGATAGASGACASP